MTGLVHCRGCAQRLHAEAAACPHCGAPQAGATPDIVSKPAGSPVLAIVSCVLGVLTLLGLLSDGSPADRDELLGGFCLSLIAIVCGALSIYHQKPGRTAAVVGLVTAGIGLLVCLGSF
ncbi:DUF4190 domain-containing protein [Variovorax sp. KBS0712]|uniref:DUF4190 domain-containing protein n=1 Tax=Variovorax sp. KBS0712 TaxID=2578111 RepID=UPI001117C912|nr:DUF4190 domain-containing protein [Variovorax sp. KBS0712]TSD56422.1 DUF4190 domain-containing protein [Variovorax sp. KBS0712]